MALYLSREPGNGSERGFRRVAFQWESSGRESELVLEQGRGESLRLRVSIGGEREEHELELRDAGLLRVNAQSKLISIEDVGESLPDAGEPVVAAARRPAPVVGQQSKLIKIEEIGKAIPDATIVLA
jgi:hypothetical protein